MNENNSIEYDSIKNNLLETIDKTVLSEQTKFRLSKIIGIENYFYQEINQRKSCSKKLNKYVTTFDYINKILIVLSATSSEVSIISFTSIIGASVGIASAILTLFFSLTTGIVKKLLNITRNKKEKHDKVLMVAKSKLNSIETLISQALTDLDMSHEELTTILKEKDKYERMTENLRRENEEYKIMRLSSIKSKILKIYFFSGYNINSKCYRVFCINKKKRFSGYNINSEILSSILY